VRSSEKLIKPVNEKKELMDSYLTDHMANLTPSQLTNLQNGVEAWTPKIRQINVSEHTRRHHQGRTALISSTAVSPATWAFASLSS